MLHKRSMLKIPTPHFITFYNGRERMKERIKILKLSDMFEHPTKHPELELILLKRQLILYIALLMTTFLIIISDQP